MSHLDFLFTLFATVFFCLGLNMTLSEGNIFYSATIWYENIYDKRSKFKYKLLYYITKPIIGCVTCMSSVWGVTWFIVLNGFGNYEYMILNSFCAAFLNTFIYKLHAKLD